VRVGPAIGQFVAALGESVQPLGESVHPHGSPVRDSIAPVPSSVAPVPSSVAPVPLHAPRVLRSHRPAAGRPAIRATTPAVGAAVALIGANPHLIGATTQPVGSPYAVVGGACDIAGGGYISPVPDSVSSAAVVVWPVPVAGSSVLAIRSSVAQFAPPVVTLTTSVALSIAPAGGPLPVARTRNPRVENSPVEIVLSFMVGPAGARFGGMQPMT
jgi:hyphal wall protein